MTPPTAAQPSRWPRAARSRSRVTPTDDEGLARVEITLRNNTTGEHLAADGTWSTTVQAGWYRIIARSTSTGGTTTGPTRRRSTSPRAATRSPCEAVDDLGLETSSNMQGRLTIDARASRVTRRRTALINPTRHPERRDRAAPEPGRHGDRRQGRAERAGVDPGERQQPVPAGQRLARPPTFCARDAVLGDTRMGPAPPGRSRRSTCRARATTPSRRSPTTRRVSRTPRPPVRRPATRSTRVTCRRRWCRTSCSPARMRCSPTARSSISGRVEDDRQIAQAQVAIVDSAGPLHELERHLHQHQCELAYRVPQLARLAGIELQLHDPGHPGGRVPGPGARIDQHGFMTNPPAEATNITVNTPANNPPVADFTYTCAENVCSFDARIVDRREHPDVDLLVELRPGHGQRCGRRRRPTRPPAPSR